MEELERKTEEELARKEELQWYRRKWGNRKAHLQRSMGLLRSMMEQEKKSLENYLSSLTDKLEQEKKNLENYLSSLTDTTEIGKEMKLWLFKQSIDGIEMEKELLRHFEKVMVHIEEIISRLNRYYTADGGPSLGNKLYLDLDSQSIDYGGYYREHVFATILDQAVTDYHTAQAAFNQRRYYGENIPNEQMSILYHSDQVALHALSPAIKAGFVEPGTVVITHFQEALEARTLPYYRALLLTIPFITGPLRPLDKNGVATGGALDYLAIPHEIGHYLFWNGYIPGQGRPIHEILEAKLVQEKGLAEDDWRWRWVEELFADLYGCLVAGPLNVLGFQELVVDDAADVFKTDIDEHPIPILRPLIQTEMLRLITQVMPSLAYTQAPAGLDARWSKLLEKREGAAVDLRAERYQLIGLKDAMSGQAIIEALQPVIYAMLEILSGFGPVLQPWKGNKSDNSLQVWSPDEGDSKQLFTAFSDYAFNVLVKDVTGLEDAPKGPGPDFSEKFIKRIEEFFAAFGVSQKVKLEDWLDIFFVVNWSSGGAGHVRKP